MVIIKNKHNNIIMMKRQDQSRCGLPINPLLQDGSLTVILEKVMKV